MSWTLYNHNHFPFPGYQSDSYHNAILAYDPDVYWILDDEWASTSPDVLPSAFANGKTSGGQTIPIFNYASSTATLLQRVSMMDDSRYSTKFGGSTTAGWARDSTPTFMDTGSAGFVYSFVSKLSATNGRILFLDRVGNRLGGGSPSTYSYDVVIASNGTKIDVSFYGASGGNDAKTTTQNYLSGTSTPRVITIVMTPPNQMDFYKDYVFSETLTFNRNQDYTINSNLAFEFGYALGMNMQYVFYKNADTISEADIAALKDGYERNFSTYTR